MDRRGIIGKESAPLASGLFLLLCLFFLLPVSVFADASGPLSPFPLTGAYSAKFIEDRDHVSVIEISGNYNKNLDSGQSNAEPRAVIAKEFFRTHPDNYDFIVAFSDFEFNTGDAAAFHWGIQNKTEGLGLPIYDITDLFGSNGKLQGFTDMAALSRWSTDPLNPKFEHTLSVLAHEILHQWGPRVRFKLPDGSISDALLGKDGAHWSYLLDSDASVEYGAEWTDNGDGTFTSTGVRTFYSPLDLYLMGMYQASEVPPITLINNPAIDKTQLPQENVTISGVKQTVTIADIVAAEGARVPDAASAQKSFRFAFVFLTGPNKGRAVTDAQLLALNNIRNAFMTRFAVLTGGRGIAQVYPEGMPINAPGAPGVLPSGDLRATPVNYDEALAWLRGRQDVLGYWSDKETTRLRDTAVVLDTLARLDPQFGGEAIAVDWLNKQLDKNSDYLARYLATTSPLGKGADSAVSELLARQNADGGWGIAGDFQSNPLDTALAVTALAAQATDYSGAISKAISYLQAVQNSDGGWGATTGGKSITNVTAQTIKAMKAAGQLTAAVKDKALIWLAGKQNVDGGFGDSPSTVHDSALALDAFIEAESLHSIRSDAVANYLLGLQGVDGSWQGSTYATALAVSVLRRFNFSNFAVREPLAASSAVLNDGQRLILSGVVANESNVPTEPNFLRVYKTDATGGSVVVGEDIPLPIIPAGATVGFSKVWDSFNQPGMHTFIAVADPYGTAVEMSELDNSAKITVEVKPVMAGAELEITGSDITAMPAYPDSLPTLMGISANVRNIGNQDRTNVRIVLWDGPVNSGVIVDEVVMDLLARTSVTANFNYTLTKPGLTKLTVQIDPDNTVPESSKDNNIASLDITTLPTIDVAVTAPDITVDKSPVIFGEDAVFTVKLHNNGTLDSPNTAVNYTVTDGNITKAIGANSILLKPGETATQTVTWRADMTGPLTFTVQLDPYALIIESDKTNNSASLAFTSGQSNGPNLVISHKDFAFSPEPGNEGSPETLTALVRNTGNQDAANIAVDFYNGDPAQNGVRIGTRQIIPTLASGGEALVTLEWSQIPDSADKLLFVVVDPDNAILESDETDNSAFNTLKVLTLPDLSISSGDIDLSPAFPVAGETMTINARVSNLGQQQANAILVRAYSGDPASGGILIGEKILPSLASNASDVAAFSMTVDATTQSGQIFVEVNPYGDIPERFSSNNSASRSLTVQTGNLHVAPVYFSPNGDGVQDETELFFRFDAPTSVAIEIINESNRSVRTISGANLENITVASVIWDGRDQLGRLVPDGNYRLRIIDANGASLGEKSVVLDTNRSSLVKAMGSGLGYFSNLTCELPITVQADSFAADGKTAFYFIPTWQAQNSGYPAGLYRMDGTGADSELIVPATWFSLNGYQEYGTENSMMPSPDGKVVYFTATTWLYDTHLWAATSDGKEIKRLAQNMQWPDSWSKWIHVSPDGSKAYVVDMSVNATDILMQASFANPAESKVLLNSTNIVKNSFRYSKSADKFAFVEWTVVGGYQPYVYDPATETKTPLGIESTGDISMEWAPDGKQLAVAIIDRANSGGTTNPSDTVSITVYNGQGNALAGHIINEFAQYTPTFHWSADSSEFAIYLPLNAIDGDGFWDPLGGDAGGIYVMHPASNKIERVLDFDYWDSPPYAPYIYWADDNVFWVPNDRVLLIRDGDEWSTNSMHAVYLNDANRVEQDMFTDFVDYNPYGPAFIGSGNKLLFTSRLAANDPTSTCYGKGYEDSFIFESLLNMKADLRVLRSADASGMLLQGTASDLNFDNYRLEYAQLDTPDVWNPVAPASMEPVVDDQFTIWIPPAPGTYLVRLTVHDLAGNTLSTIKRASWNETPSITDLYRLPVYISPNGDGIQDEAQIHYRVLAPVHLEFNFYDAVGNRVRTITRDETLIGAEVNVYWDGRDDNGIILPDGKYRLKVMNFQFTVELDTIMPSASMNFVEAYQAIAKEVPTANGGSEVVEYVAVQPVVDWSYDDTNLSQAVCQWGLGVTPSLWEDIGPPYDPCVKVAFPLRLNEYVNYSYRLKVSDKAGNTTLAETGPAPQQLILANFGSLGLNKVLQNYLDKHQVDQFSKTQIKDAGGLFHGINGVRYAPMANISPVELSTVLAPGFARIEVAETIRNNLTQVFYQYREVTEANWQEGVVDQYLTEEYVVDNKAKSVDFLATPAIPNHGLQIKLPINGFNPGKEYYLRLRAVDASGAEFTSNTIRFGIGGAAFLGPVKDPTNPFIWSIERQVMILEAATGMSPPPGDWNRILFGEEYLTEKVAEARLYVKSDTDPRYMVEKLLDRVVNPGDVAILFRGDELASCTTYTGTMVLLGEPDANGVQAELVRTDGLPFKMPCLGIEMDTQVRSAGTCGAPSPNIADIKMQPISADETPLKLLTLSQVKPGIGEDIIYNVNQPAGEKVFSGGYRYQFPLDTSNLPEGRQNFTARLVDINDNAVTQSVSLLVDHTPPTLAFTYPLEGQRVCGVPRKGDDGKLHNVLTFEADISDAPAGSPWKYQVALGEGDAPVTYGVFHDSVPAPGRCVDAQGTERNCPPNQTQFSDAADYSGPVAEISDRTGVYTAQLRVMDTGGFMQCTERTFHLDAEIKPLPPTIDRKIFSPNGDGVSDDLTITYSVDESATLDITIYKGVTDANGQVQATGPPLRHLESNLSLLPGSSSSVWDGKDDAGTTVTDGLHAIVIDYKDTCSNLAKETIVATVDNTPPSVTIAYPLSGDPLSMMVGVTGAVSDQNPKQHVLEYGVGNNPVDYLPIAAGDGNVPVAQVLVDWNTFGLVGEYTLRLRSVDQAGNESITTSLINLAVKVNLLNALESVPPLFSPNGDGKIEQTVINVGVEQDILLTLDILDAAGTLVANLGQNSAVGVGSHTFAWDGMNSNAVLAPDGVYTVRAAASLAQNPLVTQEESITIELDTTPPLVDIAAELLSGFVRSNSGVSGTISDKNLKSYALELTDTPQSPVWAEIATGATNQNNAVLASLNSLLEGKYALRVTAEDKGQIITQTVIPFEVDNTAPEIAILTPAANDVIGAKKAPVNVAVSVAEPNLVSYTLNIGAGESPATWTELITASTLPVAEPLTVLDTTAFADGVYTLQLTAVDKAGNQSTKQQLIVIDNTPPVISVTDPVDGAYIREAQDILGSVTDLNLSQYRLLIAPGAKNQANFWSEIAVATSAVDASILHHLAALPPDGLHTLKIEAKDKADNLSEYLVELTVDTMPPSAPTGLVANIENKQDIRLTWNQNPEPDVVGYHVYRDGVQISTALVTTLEYLDANMAEGRYTYTVVAVDQAQWFSEHSADVQVAIDVTPPLTSINRPADLSTVSGAQQIVGTAYSTDDFKEYRLYVADVAQPSQWTLLRSSPVPTLGDVLADWNTFALAEGAQFLLKLEGEDINGNVATDQITVTIDNQPPAAPTGVVAVATGSNVAVSWNPNTEPDLFGYLVFRDGNLVNAVGAVVGDLKSYAVTVTNYDDLALADGSYRYTVIAIDQAGNISASSLPSDVLIDMQPPHAIITEPANATVFEKPLYVLAQSDDGDIASVEFQYRTAGTTTWSSISTTGSFRPYDSTFDPAALGLAFGDYDLRSVATDLGGKIDPAPGFITVTYADLTPPAPVSGIATNVNGGDVTVSWTANTAADLAGYYVYRVDDFGNAQQLNNIPVTELLYLEQGLLDALYHYKVAAVDLSGNIGQASPIADALVYTPLLKQPYTPTGDAIVTVQGTGKIAATASGQVVSTAGSSPLPTMVTDANFNFVIPAIPLQDGNNTVTVTLTDSAGNVSKPASVTVLKASAPSKPTGLTAMTNGLDVSLAWNANPEPDILGYRIFRNATPLLADKAVVPIIADASTNAYYAPRVIDGNWFNYWPTYINGTDPTDNQWLSIGWGVPRVITEVDVSWLWGNYAVDFDIEAWSGASWIKLKQVTGNSAQQQSQIVLDRPYVTDQIRIVLHSAKWWGQVLIAEIGVTELGLVPGLAHIDSAPGGLHDYTITAMNSAGLESVPSDAASVAVGDVTPPEPVALSASVTGADVVLAWNASVSTDVSHYILYRDGQQIFQQNDLTALTYTDAGRPNGTYNYTVEVVDLSGNVSLPSNTATAVVDVAPPLAPANLTVTVDPNGKALGLSWTPPTGAAPASYNVLRSLTAGGPYSLIDASSVTTYRDSGLVNNTTYYYVVAAVDAYANQGVYSNEAFGTPLDQTAPVATITYPARAGQPYVTDISSTAISGMTEAGAMVTLNQDGVDGGQTVALAADSIMESDVQMWANSIAVSPDGRYAMVDNDSDSTIYLHNIASGSSSPVYTTGTYNEDLRWSAKSDSVVALAWDMNYYQDYLVKIGAFDGTVTTLLAAGEIAETVYAGILSPNEDVLLYQTPSGVWKKDLATGIHTQLIFEGVNFSSLRWSPDGTHVAYTTSYPSSLKLLNIASGSIATLESTLGFGALDWSSDGSHILYTSNPDGSATVIKRYDMATGISEVIRSVPNLDLYSPVFSPDERMVAYTMRDPATTLVELQILNLSTGEVRSVNTTGYPFLLRWSKQNQIHVWVGDSLIDLINPAGSFEFTDVRLHGGDNVFAVKAQDQYLNTSGLSEPVVITYDLGQKPDLELGANAIVNIPSAPLSGETVRVTVTVNNAGLADAPTSALDVLVLDEAGNSASLANALPVPALGVGAKWSISFDWTAPAAAGVYRVIAVADAKDEIIELSEGNNQAIKNIMLATTALPVMDLFLDRAGYGSNDAVTPSITVQNNGNLFSGQLAVYIEDANGYIVTQFLSQRIDNLNYGETVVANPVWGTGSTFAGGYQVHAQLFDAQQQLVAEQRQAFSILENIGLTSSVTTDKTIYPANANLLATGVISYSGGNVLLGDLSAVLSINDMNGNVLVEQSNNLGILLPGDSISTQLAWNTGVTLPGNYIVTLNVMQNAALISSATTNITIENTDRAVSGVLSAPMTRIGVGDAFSINYGIKNNGNAAVVGLPISISLYDPATQSLIDTRVPTVPQIPVAESYVGSVSFDSSALALGTYSVELFADVMQADGTLKNTNLASLGIQIVDRSLPVATILKPVDGEFLGATGLFSASAYDAHSSISGVELSIDSQPWQIVNLSDRANGIYGKYVSGLTDGPHTAIARATDTWGNMASSAITNFIVDTLPPDIAITGVANDGIYGQSVTPVVTVTDPNLLSQSITLNGTPYVSGTVISAEDVYLLEVSATDKAGNASQAALSFILDKAPPVITVAGVADGGIYNTPVTPVITVTDPNLLSQSITLNGAPYLSGTTISADGDYVLVVTAQDLAGNSATQTVSFTYDATPPVIAISGVADGAIYNTAVTPLISVTDANLASQTVTLNGAPYVSGTVISAENVYLLEVSATDKAGNVSQAALSFILDKAPPVITVIGVTDGGIYNTPVTPVITVTDPNLLSQSILLNGAPYVSGTVISAEGVYTLEISAADKAGNTSQLSLSFIIDLTPPAITVTGVADSGIYNTPVTPLISVTDANLASQTITLNGAPYVSGTTINVDGDYVLVVTAQDLAGNSATQTVNFTFDATPPVIVISGVQDGQYSNTPVTPVITVTDANLASQTITLNGAPYVSGTAITAGNTYILSAYAVDKAGNTSQLSLSFIIDLTPPAITVTGVADGGIYNTSVTPLISVTDANLASQTITLNGAPYVSGTVVSAEGVYTLEISATDKAGNTSQLSLSFIIDLTPPVIDITGVVDSGIYNTLVTPLISVTDANLASQTITLNGAPYVSGTMIIIDGDYVLAVTAQDLAGNSATQTVRFTIDTIPPVITVNGVQDGQYSNRPVTPVITVTDANLASQTITLNGAPYVSGTVVSAEGVYALVISAVDKAGNTSQLSLSFIIDLTPPAIAISGVQDGQYANTPLTPVVTVTDANLASQTITLNGAPYVSGTAIRVDGDYVLVVTGQDLAGNSATQTVRFTIDTTPPAIAISGVQDGQYANTPLTPVIAITDANLLSQSITLNGAPYVSGTVVSAEGVYTLEISAADKAGNTSQLSLSFIIDLTPPAIAISGVQDGQYANTPLTPVIAITDANLLSQSITLNGVPYVSGTTISAEGAYILNATATDKAGNTTLVGLNFVIDMTPPVLTVTGVEEGGLYNKAVAAQIEMFDANPGSLSATLNGAPYLSGTTISVDGDYVLVVTAQDLAGNAAMLTLSFRIDTTPPIITITSPLEGTILDVGTVTVSGMTEPMSTVYLSLHSYRSSTANNAMGGFNFNSVPLAEGENIISIYAIDAAGNIGPAVTVTVTYVPIEVTGTLRAPDDVVIYASRQCNEGEKGDLCQTAPHKEVLLNSLTSALDSLQTGYMIARDKHELVTALRSQRYGRLVILETGREKESYEHGDAYEYPEGEEIYRPELDDALRNEIAAMTASGMGLAWIKTHPDSNEHWAELFGAEIKGGLRRIAGIEFNGSVNGFIGAYEISGDAIRIESVADGIVLGTLLPSQSPAIVLNRYGSGNTLLSAFNPAAIADSANREEVLRMILRSVRATKDMFVPRDIAEIEWAVDKLLPPVRLEINEYLDPDACFMSAAGGEIVKETQANWIEDVLQQSRKYTALVRLPSRMGDYSVTAVVLLSHGDVPYLSVSGEMSYRLAIDATTLASDVLTSMMNMETTSEKERHRLSKAIHYFRKAAEEDPATRHQAEEAIESLTESLGYLRSMEINTSEIAEKIGYLLRIYQIRWSELTAVKHAEGFNDEHEGENKQ